MGRAQQALAAKKQELVDVGTSGQAVIRQAQEDKRKKAIEILQKYKTPELEKDTEFTAAVGKGYDYSGAIKDDLGKYFAQARPSTLGGPGATPTGTAPFSGTGITTGGVASTPIDPNAPAKTAEQMKEEERLAKVKDIELTQAEADYKQSLGDAEYVRTGAWGDERRVTLQKEIDAMSQASSAESAQEAKDVIARQGEVARNMAAQIGQQKSILTDPAMIQALQAKGVTVGDIERMQASQVGNVGDVEAAQIGPVRDAQAQQIGQMSQAEIAQIAAVDPVRAAQIEKAQQAQIRRGQTNLITQLQSQAAGEGPSLAEAQLKTAQNRNLAQQLAIAGASRGGNVALQGRQLQQNMATSGQELANQAAQARMQEQLAARQQLQSTLAGTREQDIGLATSQAGLEQQALTQTSAQAQQRNLAQADIANQVNISNVAAQNNAKLEQAKLSQQAELTNVQKALEIATKNGDFQQASRLQNQQKNIQIAIQNATLQQQSNLANVESSRAKVSQQAQIETQLSLANQQSGMTAQQANQQAQIQMQEMRLKEDQFKQSRVDEYTKLGMTFEQAAQQTNLDWNKFQEQLTQQYSGMRQQASTASQALQGQKEMNQANIDAGKAQADKAQNAAILTGALSAAGTIGGAMVGGPAGAMAGGAIGNAAGGAINSATSNSDKRIKKDVKSGAKDIKEFLSALEAKKYKYTNPEHPRSGKGDFISVMAQDLEKTKMGKQMVTEEDGIKTVNYGKGFGAILAAQVELNKRLAELESKTKKKK